MSTGCTYLRDRGVLRVSGPEAPQFLQGLVTNDVEVLKGGEAVFAALLTPQGKILFDFILLREDSPEASFLVDCPADLAPALAQRLGFYRLRSKATVENVSEGLAVAAFWGQKPDAVGTAFVDPRDERLGGRLIGARDEIVRLGESGLAEYEAQRVALCVPRGGADFTYGDIFPHDANMDLLHGLDFSKGCYVGQEVVSRMRHRSALRKRIVRLALDGAPPPPGTPLVDGELSVGVLGSSAGRTILAQARTDRIDEALAARRPLTANGVAVSPWSEP